MNRRLFWKVYFFLAVVLTIGYFVAPHLIDDTTEMGWLEWALIPLSAVQLLGLFGFAFERRVSVQGLWRLVFIASIAYEIWDWYSVMTMPDVVGSGIFLIGIGVAVLLEIPMLIALFLYGFRSRELWRAAT